MTEIDPARVALSDVAATGLLTAFCHAVESRSERPILKDSRMETIVDRLIPILARSPGKFHRLLARGRFRTDLVVYFAIRARKYDQYAKDFADRHLDGCVVNLGCGLDTRFWRIDNGRLHFYDLDLPEMITLKRELVPETDRYRFIAQSVLDSCWMDAVAAEPLRPFLFLAEGLFMYLPAAGVKALVVDLHARFPGSELAFETANARWLQPPLKWMMSIKMHRQLGLGKGADYSFGIRDAHEPETWSSGIRLLEEWDFLDEDEEKLGFLRRLRNWKVFSRSQWTVRYSLG